MSVALACIAIVAGGASLLGSLYNWRKQRVRDKAQLALNAGDDRIEELEHILMGVLDGEGNVVGQLALPENIKKAVKEAEERIDAAKLSLDTSQRSLAAMRQRIGMADRRAEREEKKARAAEHALAQAIDPEGNVLVRLRLPEEPAKPLPQGDPTPCSLCMNATLLKNNAWGCAAMCYESCDVARAQCNAGGRCSAFSREEPSPQFIPGCNARPLPHRSFAPAFVPAPAPPAPKTPQKRRGSRRRRNQSSARTDLKGVPLSEFKSAITRLQLAEKAGRQ